MTYVNKKVRVFMNRDDLQPERRRSEARLKTYPSAIDIRAWCDTIEERRQHILELVTKSYQKCTPRVIPLEAIIDALLGGTQGDSKDLKKCLAELWNYIATVKLINGDKQKLENLKKKMNQICLEGTGLLKRSLKEGGEDGPKVIGSYKVTTVSKDGPSRTVAKISGIKPGFTVEQDTGERGVTLRMVRNAFPEDQQGAGKDGNIPEDEKGGQDGERPSTDSSIISEGGDPETKVLKLRDKLSRKDQLLDEQKKDIDALNKEKGELADKIEGYLAEIERLKEAHMEHRESVIRQMTKIIEDEENERGLS